MVETTGQRWLPLEYSASVAATPQDGEMYVLYGVPNFEAPRVFVMGDGVHTVAELVAMRQYRPIYDYDDVSTQTPEAGAQVATINAPGTTLYVVVVTGDGSHTIAQLVTNFNANLVNIAAVGGVVEVAENHTVQDGERYFDITTADALIITIPDSLDKNTPITFRRSVPSANAVTAVMAGSDTVEEASSLVLFGIKEVASLDDTEVKLVKLTDTNWKSFGIRVRAEYVNQVATDIGVGNVNWETKVEDTHGAVTTGAGWKFTSPIDKTYFVCLNINVSSSAITLRRYVGVTQKNSPIVPSGSHCFPFSIRLKRGESLSFSGNAGNALTATSTSYITIDSD